MCCPAHPPSTSRCLFPRLPSGLLFGLPVVMDTSNDAVKPGTKVSNEQLAEAAAGVRCLWRDLLPPSASQWLSPVCTPRPSCTEAELPS